VNMKKVIWKYPMGMVSTHEMPEGAEFLSVQIQGNEQGLEVAMAWFLVWNSETNMVPRKFRIFGTGHEIPMDYKYLGTFQSPPFVWHLFEEINHRAPNE